MNQVEAIDATIHSIETGTWGRGVFKTHTGAPYCVQGHYRAANGAAGLDSDFTLMFLRVIGTPPIEYNDSVCKNKKQMLKALRMVREHALDKLTKEQLILAAIKFAASRDKVVSKTPHDHTLTA